MKIEDDESENSKEAGDDKQDTTDMEVDSKERPSEDKEESPVPANLPSSASTSSTTTSNPGTGQRKLVEHTYVDDEGYFVTEKTWKHDGGDESTSQKSTRPPAAQPSSHSAAPKSTKSSKPVSKPGQGKQTSLTSFFKKA